MSRISRTRMTVRDVLSHATPDDAVVPACLLPLPGSEHTGGGGGHRIEGHLPRRTNWHKSLGLLALAARRSRRWVRAVVVAAALLAVVSAAGGPLPAADDLATGVLLALLSGLPGAISGQPFLTHLWWTVPVGGAAFKLSTVLLFDLGVFFAVWGALAAYVLALLDEGEYGT